MCGITGIYSYNSEDISDIEFNNMTDSLMHRGPDGRGVYHDKRCRLRLGHRRLAILDLSQKAIQPMSFCNQRYWITFNGEIYNFIELKKELTKYNYLFQTDSDTEVILAAYDYWKEDCQNKFNGMWAFAIWDKLEQKLFLSRDRFGIKPLHFHLSDKRFIFASELKAFLPIEDLNCDFNLENIQRTIINPNFLEATETTLIKNIKRLQAGHHIIFTKRKGIKVCRWWNSLDHMGKPIRQEDQIDEFTSLFSDACKIRMRSDVPIGNAVSGGLDSSSVLAMISKIGNGNCGLKQDRITNNWQNSFSVLFPKTSQDEKKYIDMITNHTNVKSHCCSVDASCLIKFFDQSLFQLEEIFDMPIGPWLVYRELSKKKIKISLDGHGADELLGGYHHHLPIVAEDAFFKEKNLAKFLFYSKMIKSLYPKGTPYKIPSNKDILSLAIKRNLKEKFFDKSKIFKYLYFLYRKQKGISETPSSWFNIEIEKQKHCDELIKHQNFSNLCNLNKKLFLDFHYDTLPTILRNFDRCSMAHGVEIRTPFLDWRLVSFCLALSAKRKIGKEGTKQILRSSMKNILPEKIRTRMSKIGFASPMTEWFANDLKPFILDKVNSQSFLNSQIWDGKRIRNFVERSYQEGNFDNVRMSWEFIQADRLMDIFHSKRKIRKD